MIIGEKKNRRSISTSGGEQGRPGGVGGGHQFRQRLWAGQRQCDDGPPPTSSAASKQQTREYKKNIGRLSGRTRSTTRTCDARRRARTATEIKLDDERRANELFSSAAPGSGVSSVGARARQTHVFHADRSGTRPTDAGGR